MDWTEGRSHRCLSTAHHGSASQWARHTIRIDGQPTNRRDFRSDDCKFFQVGVCIQICQNPSYPFPSTQRQDLCLYSMIPHTSHTMIQVRIAERSVEGRHALVNRIRDRAPSSTVAYISMEMRFRHLQMMAATNPKESWHMYGNSACRISSCLKLNHLCSIRPVL